MPASLVPPEFRDALLPSPLDPMAYHCLSCGRLSDSGELHYTCPSCGGLLLLKHKDFSRITEKGGDYWRGLFDWRRLSNQQAVKGVFAFQELLAPSLGAEDIVYLGEGHTPLVAAPGPLAEALGGPFLAKLEGLNPTLSFKDRGMAVALSYVRWLVRAKGIRDLTVVCASTGDTSAAAALYASSLGGGVRSAVLVPRDFVTPGQLSQPLSSGARVFELPGVFDDCMRVVERLSESHPVVLLNSKNPWRVLGQESLAYEIAQQFDWDLRGKALFVPVGNAGNSSAILSGLLKLKAAGIIGGLPRFVCTQSESANPVALYYGAPVGSREYRPVQVRPSVAQAAMIGNPVSMPRLRLLAEEYSAQGGFFQALDVKESEIMEAMILANRAGLAICTQGGEALAGLRKARREGSLQKWEVPVIDSTAHPLKFKEFQDAYNQGDLAAYGISPDPALVNHPVFLRPQGVASPEKGRPLAPKELGLYAERAAEEIAQALGLPGKGGA
jgi:threonine synthase